MVLFAIYLSLCPSLTFCNFLCKSHTCTHIQLPWWLSSKEYTCQAVDSDLTRGSERSPRGGNGNPLQYSCWGNPMDRGAWQATVPGVAKKVKYNLATKQHTHIQNSF